MATLTIPLADQYTIGGQEYFQFAQYNGEGHQRLLRRDVKREIGSNLVAMLKPLARHVQVETGAILPKALSKMRKQELVNFCTENIVFEQPAPPPQPVPRLYIVTLNLSYHQNPEPELTACSVYVLPSYREGTPRSVLEAMSTGRAVVTTDAPGCRETVQPGRNGFLVPARNTQALAEAMERFILEPGLIVSMGREGRALAEEKYDVRKVNALILTTMGLIGNRQSTTPD